MKILIIEDEILIQQSLKKLLVRQGEEVETASSGNEGLKKLSEINFDRVICDLMLQDITGFDVIETAKSFFKPDDIKNKFVIMTAYSSEQVLTKAQDYGCKILNKPFSDLEEALKIIRGHN